MKHQADLLIRNSDYLNETFELTEGKSILISDGKIEAVGTAAELEERYQWKEELDGETYPNPLPADLKPSIW